MEPSIRLGPRVDVEFDLFLGAEPSDVGSDFPAETAAALPVVWLGVGRMAPVRPLVKH